MSVLSLALGLAHAGHAGQFRHDGVTPYVTHPIRVGQMLFRLPPFYQATAVIHDLMEDNKAITPEVLLASGLPPVVVAAAGYLTRDDGEIYAHFIERIIGDKDGLGYTEGQRIAAMVKVVDIMDNLMDGTRAPTMVRRYVNALKLLIQSFPEIETNLAQCPRPDGKGSLLSLWSVIS